MSTLSIRSIFDEADRRLATASYGEETLAIGLKFFESFGAHAAGSVYLRVSGQASDNPTVNREILAALFDLLENVRSTFAAFTSEDDPYIERCVQAAAQGYLNRGEALFSTAFNGGVA